MNVSSRRRVSLTPEQVWAAVSDHTGMSSWSPGVTVTLERPGDLDRNGVGAVRKVTGMGPAIREQVTAFEPPHRLGYRALSGIPIRDYAGEVTIKERNGVEGSVVTWTISASSSSRLVKIALGLVSRIFLRAMLKAAAKGIKR